jgi:hypothetical protein
VAPALGGLTPDVVMLLGGSSVAYGTIYNDAQMMVGFADNQTPIFNSVSHGWWSVDAATSSASRNWVSGVQTAPCPVSSGTIFAVNIRDYAANAFNAHTYLSGATAYRWAYLALNFNGKCRHWVGVLDTPTVTGVQTVTAPNFKPQFVMQLPSSVDTIERSCNISSAGAAPSFQGAGVFTVAAFVPGIVHTTQVMDDDAALVMITKSLVLPDLSQRSDGNVTLALASRSSLAFTSTGWQWNHSTANSIIRKWPSLAIEEYVAPPADPAFGELPLDLEVGYPEVVSY